MEGNERLIMNIKCTLVGLLAAFALVFVSGCKEKTTAEKVKEATKDTAQSAADSVKDGAKKIGDTAEKAYDKTKDAVKNTAEKVGDGGDAKKTGAGK